MFPFLYNNFYEPKEYDISQLIIIQPTVDFSTLEEVIILQRRDSYLEKIKGTLDQHWNTNFTEYFKRPS